MLSPLFLLSLLSSTRAGRGLGAGVARGPGAGWRPVGRL